MSSTSVSATVTDQTGQLWFDGSYQISFVPAPDNPVGPYLEDGQPFNTNQVITGPLDENGQFTANVPDNLTIAPFGSTWRIQVCPGATATNGCYTVQMTVTGQSIDVSAALTPPGVAVDMTSAVAVPAAYTDGEITGMRWGSTYFNLTDHTLHSYTSDGWVNSGSGAAS